MRELGSTEPIAIARSERSCAILAAEIFAPVERSLFALPSYQLQARGVLPSAPRPGVRWAASPGGAFAALLMPMAEEGRVALHANRTPEGGLPLGALGEQPCDLAIDETYVSCALVSMNGLRVLVLARESLSVTQELFLEGAMRGGVRAQEGMIVVWDDLGRVIAFDPANGRMVRDLRV
ncbi:MAG: hypothetical protein HYV09_40890 [Deltaproteobacteria bacterium]|nr:hypothetical protein [Deltaproteobacteria bacterium]